MQLLKKFWFFLLLIGIYFFRRHLMARLFNLPTPTYRVGVEYQLQVVAKDGVVLATDHYFPRSHEKFPTILIRSPYGRNNSAGVFGGLLKFLAFRFAERGYHVVIQDTRGRFDSAGTFNPYFNERQDGLDTLDWLQRQSWFDGRVATWGPSYLGIVQWVLTTQIPSHLPQVQAIMPMVTASRLHQILFPDGAPDLGLALHWIAIFQALDQKNYFKVRFDWKQLLRADDTQPLIEITDLYEMVEKQITPALYHLPATEADYKAIGKTVDFYQLWLNHLDPAHPIWQQTLIPHEQINAPAHLIGGWYDFFLRGVLEDYTRLQRAGKNPYLTIGAWHHFSNAIYLEGLREGLRWFDKYLKEQEHPQLPPRQKHVKLYVMGSNGWREMDEFPPKSQSTHFYLHRHHQLIREVRADETAYEYYCYDPANPTPILGGAQFSPYAGRKDNRPLEARTDVLTYTTPTLDHDVEIIGYVRLELYVKSSLDYTDFFGRLCDVHPNGYSANICDGLFRIVPDKEAISPDGSRKITIDMWATAHCFKAGHRIRLLISSGAHPHWMRNLGTGDVFGTEMKVAQQTIYHDLEHPSALILPITEG